MRAAAMRCRRWPTRFASARRSDVEGAVYLVCAATALACSLLLLRSYRRTSMRLLSWCGLFFFALTLENVALFVDLVQFPNVDLSALHLSAALIGVGLLLYGLVWEAPAR